MLHSQPYEKIFSQEKNYVLIDVRSPKEFLEAHIPGAINIPVFSDLQRENIGTIYKKQGKRSATKEALTVVGPNLAALYEAFESHYVQGKQFVVYCARGGMRSSTIVALFKTFSIPIIKLDNGYKGYRAYINQELPKLLKTKTFISLYGKTGVGKTNILMQLKTHGYDILDLEACANHRGSLLGSVGLLQPHSQKYFESLVFKSLYDAKSAIIFCEGESRRIGNIVMPAFLFEYLLNSKKLYIDADISTRINNIKIEYVKDIQNDEQLIDALIKLKRYMSAEKINDYIISIQNHEYDMVIENLMLSYYDKVYSTKDKHFEKAFENNDLQLCTSQIIAYCFE